MNLFIRVNKNTPIWNKKKLSLKRNIIINPWDLFRYGGCLRVTKLLKKDIDIDKTADASSKSIRALWLESPETLDWLQ